MAFDVKTNISDIFTQKSCCYISELPSYILSHSPINHALNPFERQIYALVQTRCHYGNYRLSLRTYLSNNNVNSSIFNERLKEIDCHDSGSNSFKYVNEPLQPLNK